MTSNMALAAEQQRLAALQSLEMLDTPADAAVDALAQAAGAVCETPIALVSLVDDRRQWFKARVGLDVSETPREQAFCAHAIQGDALMEVEDATRDPRFVDNPLVLGEPRIRFYAGAPIRLSDGATVGTVCVIDRRPRQLSEGQRAVLVHLGQAAAALLEARRDARRLIESQSRFRALTELAPVGVYAADAEGLCNYTNPRWQQIHGLGLAESLGRGWTRILPEEDRPRLGQAWRQAVEQSRVFDETFRIRRPDGQERHVRSRATTHLGPDGRVLGYVGTVEDVTEFLDLARRLQEEQQYLAAVIDGTDAGTWEWQVETGLLRINDRWAQMLGRSVEELAPVSIDTWLELVHPEDRAAVRAEVEQHLQPGALRYDCEYRMRHAQGHWVWVHAAGKVRARRPDGRATSMVGTQIDCSARRADREALDRAHQRLALALQGGHVGLWEFDVLADRMVWHDRLMALYGLPEDEPALSFERWLRLVAADEREAVRADIISSLRGERPFDIHFSLAAHPAGPRHIHAVAQLQRNAQGRVERLVGISSDVTQIRQLSAELAQQHELLRVTLKSIGDAVITTDGAGRVSWLNPVAERMTGWLAAEAVQQPIESVFAITVEDSGAAAANPVRACLGSGEVCGLQLNTVLRSRDGAQYGIEDSAAPIRDDAGHILGAVLVFHDVTEQRRLSREMSYRAKHDALTGLVNRQEFEARLTRVLEQARQTQERHALLFLDLDHFKLVNDACGHHGGDQLLRQVSQLLAGVVRARDTLARLGGDEFAVILEKCSREQALRVAQQICSRMDEFRFIHDLQHFRIGVSVGLVEINPHWADIAALMKAADSACYAAKEAGRNRVHIWYESDRAIAERSGNMQWATRLAQALDEQRLCLFGQLLQPLQPLQSAGERPRLEALVRLRDEQGQQLLPPNVFLPAAERFGMAARLDRWVLREALRWLDTAPGHAVAALHVNLSGQSLADSSFRDGLLQTLRTAGARRCAQLCLEITETVALARVHELVPLVAQLRELGVRLAIDDFGAGAAHFGYLKSLKVDLIKVDGQFIQGLLDDPLDAATVQGFLGVARVLGVQTVAECVDRAGLLARVRELGFDFAQGRHIGPPRPLDAGVA